MKQLTYGQKLVNTNFNPAELESVGICKKTYCYRHRQVK